MDGEGGFLEKLSELLERGKPYLEAYYELKKAWKMAKRHRVVGIPIWSEEMEAFGKQLRAQGWSYRAIAEELGVGKSTVHDHLSPKGRFYKGLRRFLRF